MMTVSVGLGLWHFLRFSAARSWSILASRPIVGWRACGSRSGSNRITFPFFSVMVGPPTAAVPSESPWLESSSSRYTPYPARQSRATYLGVSAGIRLGGRSATGKQSPADKIVRRRWRARPHVRGGNRPYHRRPRVGGGGAEISTRKW